MFDWLIRIAVNAAALWVAIQILPSSLLSFDFGEDWWKLGAVALLFALVNTYLKPIVKALSFPISVMTLGLVGIIINAAMLVLVAFVSNEIGFNFKVGDFPPDLTADTVVGAIAGSLIISLVATVLSLVDLPRRIVR